MKTIKAYPIYPSSAGMKVIIPAGAVLLNVSLNVHQYFLHVLCDPDAPLETRTIIAFKDDDGVAVPDNIGAYIGIAKQVGEYRRWHFFDQGIAPVPEVEPGLCMIGDKCRCPGVEKLKCGNWRNMGENFE